MISPDYSTKGADTMTVEDTTVDVGIADQQAWIQRVTAWSPEERAEKEKKLMRKIDLRLMPI